MSDLDRPVDLPSGWQREHLERYVATDGEDGYWWQPGVPTLLLTTIGKKSGQARRTPLIFGRNGTDFLLVASAGGSDTPPAWYTNLTANPNVRIQVKGDKFDAVARTADPAERARLWPVMTALWPDYDEYVKRTEREIPLVVITPS